VNDKDGNGMNTAEALLDLVRAFPPARLLLTATEYDLFSRIEAGAQTAADLAAPAGLHPRATEQVLNGLAACGLLVKANGRFRNTEDTRRFLTMTSPENILARFAFQRLLWERWSLLSDALKSGRVDTLPPVMERSEAELRAFLTALDQFGRTQAPRVVAAAAVAPGARLLDLGGGLGTYAAAFCRGDPTLRAVLFELPQVAPIAREQIGAEGMAARISIRGGDFLVDPLLLPGEAPYDAIFLSNIVHLFPPETNRLLLSRLSAALAPHGRLFVHDVLMEEDGVRPVYGAMLSLTMLVLSEGGATYPESEVRGWLTEVGLTQVRRVQVEEDISLLIAAAP
jgi:hypothetical protein